MTNPPDMTGSGLLLPPYVANMPAKSGAVGHKPRARRLEGVACQS